MTGSASGQSSVTGNTFGFCVRLTRNTSGNLESSCKAAHRSQGEVTDSSLHSRQIGFLGAFMSKYIIPQTKMYPSFEVHFCNKARIYLP